MEGLLHGQTSTRFEAQGLGGLSSLWATAVSANIFRSSLVVRFRRWSPVARRLRSQIPVIVVSFVDVFVIVFIRSVVRRCCLIRRIRRPAINYCRYIRRRHRRIHHPHANYCLFKHVSCSIHPFHFALLFLCIAIMEFGDVGLPLAKAAVAAGNATGSSGDSAPQFVVEAKHAPSIPRKEAAVAAENATGSSGGSASRKDAPSTAVAHIPQALATNPISKNVSNAAVAAEDDVYCGEDAVALDIKMILEDLQKRIREEIPVVEIPTMLRVFAQEIEDRTGQGLDLVAQPVGSQDDNHKHRWNRMAGANHDGTVVAGNVLPTCKAHSLGHPNHSVSAGPSIFRRANQVVPKAPPKIGSSNAMVMAANVVPKDPPPPRALPTYIPPPPRRPLPPKVTHEELLNMEVTQPYNLNHEALKWFIFILEHPEGQPRQPILSLSVTRELQIGRIIRTTEEHHDWERHPAGGYCTQLWCWTQFLASLPESAKNIVFPPRCGDTDRMSVAGFFCGQVDDTYDCIRAHAARVVANKNGVPFDEIAAFPCWSFFVRMCDHTTIMLQPGFRKRKGKKICRAVVVREGLLSVVLPKAGKGSTDGNGKGSTPNPHKGKGHRGDKGDGAPSSTSVSSGEPAVAGNGTGSDGNGSVAAGSDGSWEWNAPATEQAHAGQPAVAGNGVGKGILYSDNEQ